MKSHYLGKQGLWQISGCWFLIGILLFGGVHGLWGIGRDQRAVAQSSSSSSATHSSLLKDAPLQQGIQLYQTGKLSEAVEQWEAAILTFRQNHAAIDEALTHHYLAIAYQQLGQDNQAQQSVQQGLNLVLATPPKSKASLAVYARLLNTQGSLQLSQGLAEAALDSWQKAAKLYDQLGDRTGAVGSLVNQAQAEQHLGYFLRARETLTQAKQWVANQSDLPLRLSMSINLGQVFTHIGDFTRAQTVLSEALLLSQQQGLQNETVALFMQQGNLAYQRQQFDLALKTYQQALDLSDRPEIQLDLNLNRLQVFISQHQWSAAQTLWPQIKTALQAPNCSTVLQQLRLADSLLALHSATQSLSVQTTAQFLTQIAQQANQQQNRRAESFALGDLGRLYEITQQWSAATALTHKALQLAQTAHAQDSYYRWQWQLARLSRSQGQIAPALAYYQSAVDTLQTLRQDLVSISPNLQYTFRDQVEPIYREYVDLLLQSDPKPTPETLKTAREVIESLRLAELDYFLRSACLENRRRPLEEQIKPGTALLYPIVLGDRIATVLTLPDKSLHLLTYPIRAKQLETQVQQMRVALEKPYTAPEAKAVGVELYRALIEPAESLLNQQQITTLVFIPDGALRNIPLAALYDGQQFLMERYQVAIAPSLELVSLADHQPKSSRTLAAGLSDSRKGFSPLAFVPDELKAITKINPGHLLLNSQFTSQAISNLINETTINVVHLATHGQFSSDIDQTFVLAWDKSITLYELQGLLEQRQQPVRNTIDLLILSACETAAGDNRAALGLAGVAVQSGTRSTVATLWNVDDESSSIFMKQFYTALAQPGTTKAEALRQTQLQFLKDPDYRHPLHWAAYVLVGNWQ